MAENGHWDTSKALVRRTLEQCIHLGRQHRAQGQKQDEYEAYRLLGQAVSRHDLSRLHIVLILHPAPYARGLCGAFEFLRAYVGQHGFPKRVRPRWRPSADTSSQWAMGGSACHGYGGVERLTLLFTDVLG